MDAIPKATRDAEFIFSNYAAVHPRDWNIGDMEEVAIRVSGDRLRGEDYILNAKGFSMIEPGKIAFGEPQRVWMNNTSPGDVVIVESFNPIELGQKGYLGSVEIAIEFALKNKVTDAPYDQDSLAKQFIKTYENQIFAPGQQVIMMYQNIPLRGTVSTVELIDMSLEKPGEGGSPADSNPRARGILTRQSEVTFIRAPASATKPMNLKGSAKRSANAIVRPDFKFETLGIGGLDDEFSVIFRRAFASRIFPPNLIEQLGIMHVKGILLYGPPGTGKTLIARQIGKMLQAREPKVINGPEVLNKYVGQSEENIRKMFADAEKEYKEKGDESELHVIIFDELDAVCKQRGSGAGGGTGVGDSVVNQLLSKLDGVDQLNNILLIGMTNRKDMIDDALLRPGRLEVQVEISLPDEKGRQQILKIHTSKMRENGRIADDVNLAELAALTKNFSGAELNGLAKSAASFAFNRHTQAGSMAAVSKDVSNLVITRQDFMAALSEVTPAFGVSDEELTKSIIYGIVHFSSSVDQIINSCMIYLDALRDQTSRSPSFSLLFHGPDGSGKTSLASHIAKASEFPFIKIISPESLVGYRDEMAKRDHIHKIFTDATKSPLSILIVDDIEGLIEWNPVGPRMSNTILQTLRTLIRAIPPKGHRLLIMGTTSRRSILQQLDFTSIFNKEIPVPSLHSLNELEYVLEDQQVFEDKSYLVEAMNMVAEATQGSNQVNVGIKGILEIAGSAKSLRNEDQKVNWFAEEMRTAMASLATPQY
ncbi:AAA-domain-containing protein [Cryphonectria parasitica EP155]|uniref:Vesicular-fusion protein SEC18 n=1 Tax=Cryphonectria parasitica (strain ATCC 38755 / EP155) TaxID=660469 RepID=A0A9P4Y513_CRYP1|nr:AAA-domain-containing protein [Cryphonectria parasitica EP155]KAF3766260.1 AAA-domain-containing protein [Cryphonectria parasitica EP155]